MITPRYAQTMARYNAWENSQIWGFIEPMDQAALTEDRGAFFGSILATLNHILWADRMWLHRLESRFERPSPDVMHTEVTATGPDWWAAREEMDGVLQAWADTLSAETLERDVRWFSVLSDREQTNPYGFCVAQVFNHQTHHRGQVHAMLTAGGSKAPVSDLLFMPEVG